MRFLLSVAAIAAALSGVVAQPPSGTGFPGQSSGCTVKATSASLGSTACTTVLSPWTNILGTSIANIPIPTFDNSGGQILDAVWISWIDIDYNAAGTYNTTGSTASNFKVLTTVTNSWALQSQDGTGIFAGNGLAGAYSVDPAATGQNGVCETVTDAYTPSHTTICKKGDIYAKTFQLIDNTYASTNLPAGQSATFNPNFGQAGSVDSFEGPATTPSSDTIGCPLVGNNGIFNNPVVPGALYKGASGTWNIQTVAPVSGLFSIDTSGTGVLLNLQHSLELQVQVQYDFHLPAVAGDPQFAGFQGQSFQVHGAPESYFALISAPNYYVNARFDYLSTGKCDYNETACFTHPGTYMGLIYVGMKDANILVQAGPHATGFAGVLINDKPMQVGDRFSIPALSANSHVHMVSESKLNLVLDTITLSIVNSDLFVNFDLALTDKQLLTTGAVPHTVARGATPSQIAHSLSKWYGSFNPLHGLIGQTWRNVKYADNKLYQGDITEYQLDKIVDHTFLYCVYEN